MKRTLPGSLDQLAGLRAAAWVRESTAGQYDNFGPESQRLQVARAIERYGLIDTGIEWTVAHSGWKIAAHPAWSEMLRGAGVTFDILVVGYASRFARSLEAHVDARRAFHAAGAAILFADERILSSDEGAWDAWAREAVEAESYSRKLSRRVTEGYAAKRRRLGVPGGNRAPLGLVREGRPSVLRIDEDAAPTVHRAYELAAAGQTDREVAAQTGLAKAHVAEILTNPTYAGRLRTGEPAGVAALVEPDLWSKVQAQRERRRTRVPGRVVKRNYPLRLRCAGCGRYLHGDTGRYRHPIPTCEAFIAATPRLRRRFRNSHDKRVQGHSYPQSWYEDAIGRLLGEVGRVDDAAITAAVGLYRQDEPPLDDLVLARIEREREEAARRLAKTRDLPAWKSAMARLDAEEEMARKYVGGPKLTAPEIVDYLRSLPSLWADTGPAGRQALAMALFARTDVLGFEQMIYELTPDAIELGLDAALPRVFELRCSIAEFGRGERT
ncbi:MAG: recombinase family protein [Candidatus Limnocylindrales bacterium]